MNPNSKYTIRETLFASSKTIVYRARRDEDNCPVVLKALNAEFPSTQQLARLHREYRMTRDIAVDGVIQVMGIERFGTSAAIVVEDFGAHSLAFLRTRIALELPEALGLAIRLAGILGRVHRRNVIHKDINLSNIIWNPDTDELKLIDFGIAVELSREAPSVLSPHVLEGTLPYISPEATGRMNRPIDYRTDFYSLGVTLYELFTGQLPFKASDPMELVHCHIARRPIEPHVLAPRLPAVLSGIIMRLLAKCAEDRYQSGFALAADLRRCQEALRTRMDIPSFELGSGDSSTRLQLPQKLYGRAHEVEALLAAFGRVASGTTELVLVGGYSGIGKSVLVHEVYKPIVERRGYFISGKFDQLNRNVPYASLVQAFRELARQLLTEPAGQLSCWKERLLSALGASSAVICEVIPEFKLILGPQPALPELPPTETRNRFNLTFERFVRTVAAPEHPLVIFLDDLQWADLPSVQLMERLLTGVGTHHLLVIGAYRDNEVSDAHPLFTTVAQMRNAGATLSTLTLAPLSLNHCIQCLVDALNCEASQVEPLARLCLRKTEGNPFFLGQFLLSLCDKGMIAFDEQDRRWTWDMERISHTPMSDNVVELMAAKIQGLPRETLDVLQLAACVGNSFELKTLAIVAARSPRDIARALWAALQEGLILPTGDAYKFIEDVVAAEQFIATRGGSTEREAAEATDLWQASYRFLHDRVQQAAYSLIPEEKRPEVHLRIGRLMLSALEPEARGEQLFAIVGHLNLGAPLLGSQQERDELSELNLAAGRKAKASAAHTAAKEYLLTGIALLGDERWIRRYELALNLHTLAVESCFLSGDFESMEHHISQVLAYARDPIEKLPVYEIKCSWLRVNQRTKESVEYGLELLAQFGVQFPRPVTPEHIVAASAELTAALGGRSTRELAFLPPMTDPLLLATTQLLTRINTSAHAMEKPFFIVAMLRRIAIALKHGNDGSVADSYSSYSVVLTAQGEFEAAYEFGRLALYILEQYDARKYAARVLMMWNVFPRHFKESLRESMRGCQDAYPIALEVGDIEAAGWLAVWCMVISFLLGHQLEEVDASAISWSRTLGQMNLESARTHANIVHQAVQNLRGLSADPCRLVGTVYDETKIVPSETGSGDSVERGMVLLYRLMLCGLLGRYAEAIHLSAMPELQMAVLAGSLFLLLYHFFDALAHLALQPMASAEKCEQAQPRVAISLAKLKVWAENAPMNYAARYTLLLAEQSRVVGEAEKARAQFYRAIALAQEHQLPQDEALATERFAFFLSELREQEAARFFMAKTRHLYQVWGAKAKVREIDRAFPDLRPLALALSGSSLATASLEHISTDEHESIRTLHALDLLSILKASQAISEEMVLKDLMEKLLRIVVENAGARWGLLMLEGERALVAVAKRSGEAEEFSITLHESRAQAPVEFSQAIVRYVERTREVVVLGDASSDRAFRSDPYIIARQTRSVLCMPILYQKKQAGILYLENELLANAFTPERCRVLELLVAQAAISLENAKLYDTLEIKVKERTHALTEALQRLQETQKQLVEKEKLASLGSLTSGIAHEIRNPLNFVNNFSEHTVSLVSELCEELKQWGQPRPARFGVVEQLLSDVALSAGKIREHGARADRIIQAMLEHARSVPRINCEMDINAVVREHVHLAMSGYKARDGRMENIVQLQADYDESLDEPLVAPEEIGRVILNLVGNALYALEARQSAVGQGFVPQLEVKTHHLKDCFEIRIRDNGGGIPSAAREKIFTPFFTTKPPGEGTGLGLSISYDIITGSGGRMEFSSVEGESTEFVVVLPKRTESR